MKKLMIAILSILTINTTTLAQYYYKDIVSPLIAKNDQSDYKAASVRTINIKSFEANGEPTEDFICEKKISKDYKTASLFTRTGQSGPSLMKSFFDDKGYLTGTVDSSKISASNIQYYYDNSNRLIKITSSSKSNDEDFENNITEEHLYEYNQANSPVKMTKIKNGHDSTVYLFSTDESHNVTIEKDTKTGAKYYYYYDNQHRLTDIVHANEYSQKLIADYLFEYNSNGKMSQMTATEAGDSNYTIWKYTYENNLRIMERFFTKEKKLLGRIEYEYK